MAMRIFAWAFAAWGRSSVLSATVSPTTHATELAKILDDRDAHASNLSPVTSRVESTLEFDPALVVTT
jgi:hypothetical protein